MATRRERIVIDVSDEQIAAFSDRMKRMDDAADRISREMRLAQATWEPHDWAAFR